MNPLGPMLAMAEKLGRNPTDARIERGEHPSLDDVADMLDSGMPICQASRHYIAELLRGNIKRPDHRVRSERERRDQHDRQVKLIKASGWVNWFMAMERRWNLRPRTRKDEVIDVIADKLGLDKGELREWMRSSQYQLRSKKCRTKSPT